MVLPYSLTAAEVVGTLETMRLGVVSRADDTILYEDNILRVRAVFVTYANRDIPRRDLELWLNYHNIPVNSFWDAYHEMLAH